LIAQLADHGLRVFNFHVPPYGRALDVAPVLDETLKPVVRAGHVVMDSVG
jgi:Icc-related predicted phosphoesterase